jgi:hypothetical protein
MDGDAQCGMYSKHDRRFNQRWLDSATVAVAVSAIGDGGDDWWCGHWWCLLQGKLSAALSDYNTAIQLCPWSVDPVINRGVVLEALSRCDRGENRARLCAVCSVCVSCQLNQ